MPFKLLYKDITLGFYLLFCTIICSEILVFWCCFFYARHVTHQKNPLSPWSPLHQVVEPIFTSVHQSLNYSMLATNLSSCPSPPELPGLVFSFASTPCSVLLLPTTVCRIRILRP